MTDQVTNNTPDATSASDEALSELVGEGKKYATKEAALASILPAQKHIETLETELRTLREKEESSRTIEEVLEAVRSAQAAQTGDTSSDPEDLIAIISSVVEQKSKEQLLADRRKQADTFLKQLYGEKAEEVKAKKAAELGVGVEFLDSIAATSPKAFEAYFQAPSSNNQTNVAPTQSTVNIPASGAGTVKEGSARWYSQQRKEKGMDWYLSKDVQLAMMKDKERLGKEF